MKTRLQLARFCLVGAVNTGVHLAVVAVAVSAFGLTQLLSNGMAYLVASSASFLMNSVWSFDVAPSFRRYARFQLVGLLGLVVSTILGHLGDRFHWPYVMTVFMTVLMVPLASFVVHRRYTFASLLSGASD